MRVGQRSGGGVLGLLPLGLDCRAEVKGQQVPVCWPAAAAAG